MLKFQNFNYQIISTRQSVNFHIVSPHIAITKIAPYVLVTGCDIPEVSAWSPQVAQFFASVDQVEQRNI